MKRVVFAKTGVCVVALLGAGLRVLAQGGGAGTSGATGTSGAGPVSTLSSSTSLVVVPALVRDAKGEVVYGLKAADFTLTDDGVSQALHLEEDTGGEPLALVVVIEADAATRAAGWHPYTKKGPPDRFHGVPAMVEAITAGVRHETAVVGFDSRPELELAFTRNSDDVSDTVTQLDHGNTGDHGAGILDALVFAVDLLRHAPVGYRRAVLLLSETNDRGSTHTLEQTLRAITETNTAIYSVAFSTPLHEASEYGSKELPTKAMPFGDAAERQNAQTALQPKSLDPAEFVAQRIVQGLLFGVSLENPDPYPAGGCMAVDPHPHAGAAGAPIPFHDRLGQAFDCLGQLAPPLGVAKMALIAASDEMRRNVPQSVARLTGGEYFEFSNARTLEEDLAMLANHVPNRYILSFQPQVPHAGLHILQLRLREYPQLKVTARTSYWAEPAQ